jgi:uncharacterized protein YoxC
MDPLSITAGSIALAKTCIEVGFQVHGFISKTKLINTAVNTLLLDVEGFGKTLDLMQSTVQDPAVKRTLGSSGHVGNHWANVNTTLKDAEKTFESLLATLSRVDQSVSILDSARKTIRLRNATDEIGMYQQQIRSYRDIIQVSLQTAIM